MVLSCFSHPERPPSILQLPLLIARMLSAHPVPNGKLPGTRIVTSGHIGGNDLPGQGQRQPQQSFRKWNSVSDTQDLGSGSIVFCHSSFFVLLNLISFLLYLVIPNTLNQP